MKTPTLLLILAASALAADDYGSSTAAPALPPPQPGPAYLEAGPMLGHVSASDARIWVKSTGAAKVAVRVSESADLTLAPGFAGPELKAESGFAGHMLVPGLKPATRYFYSVLLDGQPVTARPWPSFTTAPTDGSSGKVRFAFGSCVGKEPWLDAATWADLEARTAVDFILLLGDNHYANTVDPEKQRAAYAAHRRTPGFLALTSRTPLYGIWDDHDFGPNDSDGTLVGKERSLETFTQFFANPGYGEPENPGVYFKFTRGDVDVFMLDGRYHRSPNKAPADESKTMLGTKQLEWLKRELLASKGAVKFIGIGGEWQAKSQADSWTSFTREKQEIFDFLAEHEMRNVLFLSGDRHFTAAYQVDGRFIEVSSGPLGSPNAKLPKQWPDEMFTGYDRGRFYTVWDIETAPDAPPRLALEIYETGFGLLEKRSFTWDEVTGMAKIPASPKKPAPPAPKVEAPAPVVP